MAVFQIKIEIQLSINVGSTAILWEGRSARGRKKGIKFFISLIGAKDLLLTSLLLLKIRWNNNHAKKQKYFFSGIPLSK